LPIKSLYGFKEGLFFVQDGASQICALELEAKPGDLILDVCAAPGGKSLFIGQAVKNSGRIIALDLHKKKLSLIENSAKRLGIDIIETYEHDSSTQIPEHILDSKADCVLCDVPCSGLGVIAKKPEIKYKPLEDILKLPDLQYKILANCAEYLKPGGILVYSTCTLNKKENEDIVYKFLQKNDRFKLEHIKTFFPFERKTDGFFLAKMRGM
jgi:16S rRNA (cytosine967-C5)-methyltransferase